VGRWLTKDPIGFAGGDTNLYRYASNDPVNFVDMSGTVVIPALLANALAGAVSSVITGPKPNIRVTRGNSVKIRLNLERRETILLYNSRDYSEWSPYQNAIEKTFEPFFAL
jgi:uncharacterized protein RhaS with RHS repeats